MGSEGSEGSEGRESDLGWAVRGVRGMRGVKLTPFFSKSFVAFKHVTAACNSVFIH